VQCLLIPHQRVVHTNTATHRRRALPFVLVSSSVHQTHHHHDHTSSSSRTALHLFFDKFLHPYGISPSNNNDHDNNDDDGDLKNQSSSVELLNALLPRIQTKEDKSRVIQGFQRARLDEQLRLSKKRKRGSDGGGGGSSDEQNAHLFQRARLAEQLRLVKNKRVGLFIDKDEAFQRALLEERLLENRNSNLQPSQSRQTIRFVNSSDAIEKAMMEYEHENEEYELLHMTMGQENEHECAADNSVNDSNEESQEDVVDGAFDISSTASANYHGDGNSNAVSTGEMPVNQTDDATSKQLSDKLEKLHQMVAIMTTSPSTRSIALSSTGKTTTANNTTPFSIQHLLSTTHLPLSPREDASLLSLVLAPIAHVLSSMFLLGAAGFYAVMALLDVIWNDNKVGNSTRSCLREASSVCKSCWKYVFPAAAAGNEVVNGSAVQRTLRALYTFVIAMFYATQCVFVRAAKYSKYANECMDAGTGALRYMVYALRSVKVLSIRVMDSLRISYRNKSQKNQNIEVTTTTAEKLAEKLINLHSWKHKLNPLRLFSSIKSTAAQRKQHGQRSLPVKQPNPPSDELYNTKLHLLNQDRVALERDRLELKEAQQQLELERGKLLNEGVNVLAWYSAASEAAVATEQTEKQEDRGRRKKRQWWHKREEK